MKLLRIEAHGFKSFADKIEINVGDGITGIVGPNGSGKSNVVDAVRWVLGENSLKEIRGGDTSTDVIFAGSSSRAPSTRAYVSLTFDNHDHYLASDFDEIEIKREVYKTGENEYFINNTKVRKKDITDLFIDSGTNADSFSIISQGKIMEILKGKPQDRRQIIEQAAEVLKYKKRKEETMRKLANTNDNLEKINLVINELEVNVEPLRIQAEVATKYLEYKKELEGVEISLLASDIKKINDEYQENQKKLDELNEEILKIDSSSSIDNTKLEKLKTKNIKLDEQISKLQDELIKINEEVSEVESKRKVVSERKKYEVEDQKLETNILLLKERNTLIKKNINTLNREITDTKDIIEKKTSEFNNVNDEYRVNNQKKTTLLESLQIKAKEEVNIKNRIDVLTETLETDSRIPYAVKSVLNNPRLSGIHDVLCKLIDTEEKYTTAIETALGANANVIIVDDEKVAKNAINYLKDNKLGRATFFPISIIKSKYVDDDTLKICKEVPGFINRASELVTFNPLYKSIVENQLGNVLVVNNIDTMNILGKKINYRYRIITLDGEVSHTGGAMSGGINKKSNGILNIKYEIDKLNKEINVITSESKKIEEHINEIDNDLKILEDKLFHINGELSSIKEVLNQKEQRLNEFNNELKDNEFELSGTNNILNNETDKELDELANQYLELSKDKDKFTSELKQLKTTKSDIFNEINEIESINRKEMSEYNKKLNEIKNIEVSLGKMDIKLDNSLNRLSDEYQITYEKAIMEYPLEMDENVARIKVNHLKRDIKELGDVNVGSIAEFERVNTRYTFLTDQKNDLVNAINDLMEVISDLDETMIKRFKDTFDKVNEEFGKVFKRLFKGGEAHLTLTDPEDLLNTGVEITALPPGKSLKSINALSGGEMTLTAISLLFSILNIRTVPFCILDEVEAALDEANVDTFGTYVKEYEHNSQFIVITHKKRTMEYANTLYGITMQESGVSKLVSVRLENIE